MNEQQMPEAPQAPKAKMSTGKKVALWIGGTLVALWIVGTIVGPQEAPAPIQITAEMVVDGLGAKAVNGFCTAYFQLGDYDLAFAAFAHSYKPGADGPSAESVFDEALSRC